MNSVMDDNKLLTLANGERIRLENYCALIFEVGNLGYASPATVSRAGMVYVDPKNLGFESFWTRWLRLRPECEWELLEELYEKFIPGCIEFILEGVDGSQQGNPLKLVLYQTNLNMVTQFCNVFDAVFAPAESGEPFEDDVLNCGFVVCLYTSLGATIAEMERPKFDAYVKKQMNMITVEDTIEKPANANQCPTSQPMLYSYFFDNKNKIWTAWEWVVPTYGHNRNMKMSEILVPTVDTLQINHILGLMTSVWLLFFHRYIQNVNIFFLF